MLIPHLLSWTFSHQRVAQWATLEPFGWKATSQESLWSLRTPEPDAEALKRQYMGFPFCGALRYVSSSTESSRLSYLSTV